MKTDTATPPLDHLLKFVDLIHQFRAIERRILVKGSERSENDGEHSFSLAMLGWYINSTHKLGLESDKIFKYALAHDLVEVYAGDTFFYTTDASALADKHSREAAAAERLRSEFPEFPELHEAIATYEARKDIESNFIYALDKVEPLLGIYRDNGRTWRKDHVTLDMITFMKTAKVAAHPTIEKIFHELVARLKTEHSALFEAQTK